MKCPNCDSHKTSAINTEGDTLDEEGDWIDWTVYECQVCGEEFTGNQICTSGCGEREVPCP